MRDFFSTLHRELRWKLNTRVLELQIRVFLSLFAVVCELHICRAAAADSFDSPASAIHAANDIAWLRTTVRILDPNGRPVPNACVRTCGLRAGTAEGPWGTSFGGPVRAYTDASGKADVEYPVSIYLGIWKPLDQVLLTVSHREFCTSRFRVDVPSARITDLTLKRGVILRIAGVNPGNDQLLPDCHVLLENGESDVPEFTRQPDGWMQSIPVREDRQWFRVVYAPPEGPPRFSKPQAWTREDAESRKMRIEVFPGVRVIGKLSENVVRPIERGRVVAWCGSPIRRNAAINQQTTTSSWWMETVTINRDGTFEFPSLPSGYMAQFYAVANDAISAQPTNEAYQTCCHWFGLDGRPQHEAYRYAQILRLSGGHAQIELRMEQGGSVKVKCVDADGHPVARMAVHSCPTQDTIGIADGNTNVICVRRSSLDRLTGNHTSDRMDENPFSAVTNTDGEAMIRNFPRGEHWIFAHNESWTNDDGQQFRAVPGTVAEFTTILQRR